METFVFTVMVDKHGTLLSTLVSAHQDQSGTGMHALIHAVEEEFLIQPVANVFAQQVTGMEPLVLFVQILKFGHLQD